VTSAFAAEIRPAAATTASGMENFGLYIVDCPPVIRRRSPRR
jgi:hypothetical protein